MAERENHIAVVGSLNVDYVTKVGRLPVPGETVAASGLEMVFGGKGANQAIAAVRQGLGVSFIGSVGDDDMGRSYLEYLEKEGIQVEGIRQLADVSTGAAFINVDPRGENTIVVSGGANDQTSPDQIRVRDPFVSEAKVLLAQFEVPLAAIVEALKIANRSGVTTIVNPSPMRSTFPWATVEIDFLILNETEAADLLEGLPLSLAAASSLLEALHGMRIGGAVITRGSDSTLVISNDVSFEAPTLPVVPVDTVGAGDAFAGCFAARLAAGEPLREAVLAANCAGALTTLRSGAQSAIPDRARVDQHREQLHSGQPT